MTTDLQHLASEVFCYVTTTGRVSGRPHTIEIWFALNERTLYLLSGGMERSDWVKNARRQPDVTVKITSEVFSGQARLVNNPKEDALARRLIGEKYQQLEEDLDEWLRSSLPVAVDLLNGKNIPVARTSGDAAQKRDLWYSQLPLAAAALSSNLAGIIGKQ